MSAWAEYVERISGGASQTAIADKSGLSQSAVNRWHSSTPKPETVAAFARAYGRPVLEAFVAAGFLTKEEAALTEIRTAARDLSDEDLVAELQRRIGGNRRT